MRTLETLTTAAGMLAALSRAHPITTESTIDASDVPALESRQAGGPIRNADGTCADMTIVFARGTTEPGNVGTLVGPPFFDAVKQQARGMSVAVQGVQYPADIPGFLAGGDANGSKEMARQVTNFATKCPNTKIVMSGYSQGGQLVHNAAAMLPASVTSRVSSAVIFGDPQQGKPVQGIPQAKTKVICHNGDNICQGGFIISLAHLSYNQDAATAAQFVMAQAGR